MTYLRYFVGNALILAGGVHWLIVFGYIHEEAPTLLTVYFHSLTVFDVVAGVGILMNRRYGFIIAFCIALTQISAHGYMLYIDTYLHYESGLSFSERVTEIGLSLMLTAYTVMCIRSRTWAK